MKPGRELDALIATEVMGWKRLTYAQKYPGNKFYLNDHRLTMRWHSEDGKEQALAEDSHDYYQPKAAWSPSTDITAAWEVFETVSKRFPPKGPNEDAIILHDPNIGVWFVGFGSVRARGNAETAPLAICLAALKAVGA